VRQIVSLVIVDLRDKSGRWYRHIHIKDLKSLPATDAPTGESGAANDVDDVTTLEPETDDKPEFEDEIDAE